MATKKTKPAEVETKGASEATTPTSTPVTAYPRQNDPAWGKETLGEPTKRTKDDKVITIGMGGCLLVALTTIRNKLVEGAGLTPLEVNAVLVKAGAFHGAMLVPEKAAAALGLVAPDVERYRTTTADQSADSVSLAMKRAFAAGRLCILQVDHDSMEPGGDPYGDHFVAGLALEHGRVRCADPATGTEMEIDVETTMGKATWSKLDERLYRVVSVIPIWLAKPQENA